MSDPVPECLNCGCCCFSELAAYVRVTGEDYARLGEQAERWVEFDGFRAHLRMRDGHCSALSIRGAAAGIESGAQYFCEIYDQRPTTCRELERGSMECRAERHEKHDRPERARLRVIQ